MGNEGGARMMSLSQAAFMLGVEHHNEDVTFTSVGADSRNIVPGRLFIALRGRHFDAHQYIPAAREAGAVAVIADDEGAAHVPADMPLIVVNNTRKALTQLAYGWRSRFTIPVVALTGSSGKTSVKEMLASILNEIAPGAVHATRGNLNNDIGVPLTLLELRDTHKIAVIELGMNHAGEISALTQLTRPDIAVVNNAGRAHIENLGSEAAIARAKGEIFEGMERLGQNGTAVINADDQYAELWLKLSNKNKQLRFGLRNADISARYQLRAEETQLTLLTPLGEAETTLHAPGLHNVRNALAATAAAVALDVPLADIARGLAHYAGYKGRLQKRLGIHGATLIDDTYNANPESVHAAIDVLARIPGERVLVLGDMGELGEHAGPAHRELGDHARAVGIAKVYTLGQSSALTTEAFGAGATHYADIEALVAGVSAELSPQTTVLVKGSRFMKMERVIDALLEPAGHKRQKG